MSARGRVTPGDSLSRRIKAGDWNALLDLLGELREPPGEHDGFSTTIARVKNDTANPLPRFGAVGLGAPIITPTQNLAEWKRQPTFKVVKPATGTHEGKWGVLLEPLGPGKIGAAMVAGVCQVRLTGTDVGFAEIQNASTVLTASATGSAKVLWADAGSSERDATVRIGDGVGTGGGGGSALTVEESDGSPTVASVDKIIIDRVTGVTIVDSINWSLCTNTTKTLKLKLTDSGSGDVTISLEAV